MNPYADIMYKRRAATLRPRMSRADRAKIFAPYAALKGFDESAKAEEGFVTDGSIVYEKFYPSP